MSAGRRGRIQTLRAWGGDNRLETHLRLHAHQDLVPTEAQHHT